MEDKPNRPSFNFGVGCFRSCEKTAKNWLEKELGLMERNEGTEKRLGTEAGWVTKEQVLPWGHFCTTECMTCKSTLSPLGALDPQQRYLT